MKLRNESDRKIKVHVFDEADRVQVAPLPGGVIMLAPGAGSTWSPHDGRTRAVRVVFYISQLIDERVGEQTGSSDGEFVLARAAGGGVFGEFLRIGRVIDEEVTTRASAAVDRGRAVAEEVGRHGRILARDIGVDAERTWNETRRFASDVTRDPAFMAELERQSRNIATVGRFLSALGEATKDLLESSRFEQQIEELLDAVRTKTVDALAVRNMDALTGSDGVRAAVDADETGLIGGFYFGVAIDGTLVIPDVFVGGTAEATIGIVRMFAGADAGQTKILFSIGGGVAAGTTGGSLGLQIGLVTADYLRFSHGLSFDLEAAGPSRMPLGIGGSFSKGLEIPAAPASLTNFLEKGVGWYLFPQVGAGPSDGPSFEASVAYNFTHTF